jgi:hypothetical protein
MTPKGPGSCSHLSEASMSEEDTTVSVMCLCLVPELIRPLCFAPSGEVAPGGTGPDTSLLLLEEVTAVEGESSSFSECVTSNSSPAEIALSRHSSIWSHRMLLFSWMYGATCTECREEEHVKRNNRRSHQMDPMLFSPRMHYLCTGSCSLLERRRARSAVYRAADCLRTVESPLGLNSSTLSHCQAVLVPQRTGRRGRPLCIKQYVMSSNTRKVGCKPTILHLYIGR